MFLLEHVFVISLLNFLGNYLFLNDVGGGDCSCLVVMVLCVRDGFVCFVYILGLLKCDATQCFYRVYLISLITYVVLLRYVFF